jgi:hypothetical protein
MIYGRDRRPTVRRAAHGDVTPAGGRVTHALADRRLGRRELPIVGILGRIQHRHHLAHSRPTVDVDRHALIHGVLIEGGSVDYPRDRDVLLTDCVRSRADAGHQQRAARQLTTRTARDEPLGKEDHQDRHQ